MRRFAIFAAIVIAANVAASFLSFRIDLTSDSRYTLSKPTKALLKQLDDIVYVKVYLDGDMPIAFKKMRKSIKEQLDEFANYSHKNVQYEFVNPSAEKGDKQKMLFEDIYKKGLRPLNVQENEQDGGINQRTLFPGAVIAYKGYEIGVNFMSNNPSLSPEETINVGLQNLEYNLISAIEKLTMEKLPKIAFIQGHGELDALQLQGALSVLSEYFDIDSLTINGRQNALDSFSTAIIAKPMKPWNEADKLALDQYIMKGGKVAWFIDPVVVNEDSLSTGEMTFGLVNSINLDDQLFHYGVRINPTVLQDAQSVLIPVNMAAPNTAPNFVPSPWYYFPLLTPSNTNIITKNINLVKSQYPGSIDTVGARKHIRKTVLLTTSQYTHEVQAPLMIGLSQVTRKFEQHDFNREYAPVAMLLEGQFPSAFQNRMISGFSSASDVRKLSAPTKMAVIADGDIVRSDFSRRANGVQTMPLGYDRYMNQQFGNRDFLLNVVSYLNDNTGLMQIRNRELVIRMLDKSKIYTERNKWIAINAVLPLVLLASFGCLFIFLRKRKYTR